MMLGQHIVVQLAFRGCLIYPLIGHIFQTNIPNWHCHLSLFDSSEALDTPAPLSNPTIEDPIYPKDLSGGGVL
jgi:hypothetical protein